MIRCAQRELEVRARAKAVADDQEESGLVAKLDHLQPMGRLVFTRPDYVCIDIAMFAVNQWSGQPRE
jgi:hypothetical protein